MKYRYDFLYPLLVAAIVSFQGANPASAKEEFSDRVLERAEELSRDFNQNFHRLSAADQFDSVISESIKVIEAYQDTLFGSTENWHCVYKDRGVEFVSRTIAYNRYIDAVNSAEFYGQLNAKGREAFAEMGYFDGSLKQEYQELREKIMERIEEHGFC